MMGKPDSKVHGANMGPIWGWHDPDGPHVGPMNLAFWEYNSSCKSAFQNQEQIIRFHSFQFLWNLVDFSLKLSKLGESIAQLIVKYLFSSKLGIAEILILDDSSVKENYTSASPLPQISMRMPWQQIKTK